MWWVYFFGLLGLVALVIQHARLCAAESMLEVLREEVASAVRLLDERNELTPELLRGLRRGDGWPS